jgi:tRNA(Ile)-lysidine synthase
VKPEQFVAEVRRTMARRRMDGEGVILVAVSGGPDSLALLHALHRLRQRLVVAHFDHRLRPGSSADARFVERAAATLKLDFAGGRAEDPALPQGRSPEEAMRERRLAFLERTAVEVGAGRIATGHTMDDQAETVLMRLITGAGRRGLGGIPPIRGPYVRPLIDLLRSDTEAFCRSLKLSPRRDESNADPAYLRNAVRAELLPLVADRYNARIVQTLARMADLMRDEDAYLEGRAAAALQAEVAEGGFRLDAAVLASLPVALQRRVLRRLVPAGADQVERVRELAQAGQTGDQIDLGGGLKARLEYGWLVLGRGPSPRPAASPATLRVPGETDLPAWGLRMQSWFEASRPRVLPDGRAACALDAARAREPLVVRRPRPGDRFRPLGMSRSKKLGDFFTDEKVPRDARESVPVVTAGGEIVWVVGHRPDDRAKVTRATKRVLMLTVSPDA